MMEIDPTFREQKRRNFRWRVDQLSFSMLESAFSLVGEESGSASSPPTTGPSSLGMTVGTDDVVVTVGDGLVPIVTGVGESVGLGAVAIT